MSFWRDVLVPKITQSNIGLGTESLDQPLSFLSTTNPDSLKWKDPLQFQNAQLYWQGEELSAYLKKSGRKNTSGLARISQSLKRFCDFQEERLENESRIGFVGKNFEKEISKIISLCAAFQERIAQIVREELHITQSGDDVSFEDGHLVVNGVNMHLLVQTVQDRPQPKALAYLKGVRRRLRDILARSHQSTRLSALKTVIEDLLGQMDQILC